MKKNFIFCLLLLTLIMLSVTALPTSAMDYTKVGVKVGDTASYSYSNPQGNGTLQIYIQQITGTNVTLNIKTINSNGSDTPNSIITGNLSDPIKLGVTLNKIYFFLITSNLGQGDSLTPDKFLTIDRTTTMSVAGSNRTVNHVSCAIIIAHIPSGGYYFDAYWDKATGLAVRSNITITGDYAISAGIPAGSHIMNLTSTTAFGNNIDPIALLITAGGITILLVAAAIAVFAQKKQKTTTSK